MLSHVLSKIDSELSSNELRLLEPFRVLSEDNSDPKKDESVADFAFEIIRTAQKARRSGEFPFGDLGFVSPTSVEVERLFPKPSLFCRTVACAQMSQHCRHS
jgi:hypothetical protein